MGEKWRHGMESICSISLELKGRRDATWIKSGGIRLRGVISEIGRAVDVWHQSGGVMGTGGWRVKGQSACSAPGRGKRVGEG